MEPLEMKLHAKCKMQKLKIGYSLFLIFEL
jgi:hypothetical protein